MLPQIKNDVILAPFTTFKIGGPARFFAVASNKEELIELIKWAKESPPAGGLPVFLLGGGSNILISDKGFNGLVIQFRNSNFEMRPLTHVQDALSSSSLRFSESNDLSNGRNPEIFAEAGVSFPRLIVEAANAGLAGLEWAIGIPGTIGGAINGNAGAYRKHISGAIKEVEVLNIKDMSIKIFRNNECDFDYRESVFKKNANFIILSAVLELQKGNPEEIRKAMKEIISKRNDMQEGGLRCAGCVFKNIRWERSDIDKKSILSNFPELERFSSFSAIPVSFLIDQLGLKGRRIGDAEISKRHANYFVNLGNAKAEDVVMLIGIAKEKVHQKYNLFLEEEIKYVGF